MLKKITLFFACISCTILSAQEIGDIQKGKLNYYNDIYHGRPTASGEIYDKTKVSAAHKDLPMRTMVEVTNLENNKSIFVEINDRIPEGSDAVLELSRAAAEQLDFINDGITDGQIRIIQVLRINSSNTKKLLATGPGDPKEIASDKKPIELKKVKLINEAAKSKEAKMKASRLKMETQKKIETAKAKAVVVEPLKSEEPQGVDISLEEAIAIGEKKFGIQLGAYKEKQSLNEALTSAKKEGMNLKVDLFILSEQTDAGVLYKLIYGYFGEDFARNKLEKLKPTFKDSFLKKF